MNNKKYAFWLLILSAPLFAQYNFNFVCTSDTFQTGTDYFVYYFRLTNTGTQPDSYAFDCRVVDSVSNWFEIYCAGGQCAEPGIILYDYLTPGAIDTGIDISVYPATGFWGTEKINLLVWSLHNPSLRDSINVYAAMEQGIYESSKSKTAGNKLEIYPNPFKDHIIIKYENRNPKSETDSKFQIPGDEKSICNIAIYDVSGRIVKLFNFGQCIGQQVFRVVWFGDDEKGKPVPEGVYFIKVDAGNNKIQRKVVRAR